MVVGWKDQICLSTCMSTTSTTTTVIVDAAVFLTIFSVLFVAVKQNILAVLPLSHQHAEVRSFLHRARQRMNWPLELCRRCSFRWKLILQVWDWAAGSHPWARYAEIEADALGMGIFCVSRPLVSSIDVSGVVSVDVCGCFLQRF